VNIPAVVNAVFVRDGAGSVRFKFQSPDGPWYPTADFDTIPFPVATLWAPAAMDIDGLIWVFAVGVDHQLYAAQWFYSYWSVNPLGGNFASAPAAISLGSGMCDLFLVDGATSRMARVRYRNGAFGAPSVIGGPTFRSGSTPALVSYDSGAAALVAVAADGSLQHLDFAPGLHQSCAVARFGGSRFCFTSDYSGWTSLGGYLTTAPKLVAGPPSFHLGGALSPNTVDVVARGGGALDLWHISVNYDPQHNVTIGSWTALGLNWVSERFALGVDALGNTFLYAAQFGRLFTANAGVAGSWNFGGWTLLGNPDVEGVSAGMLSGATLGLFGTNDQDEVIALAH
jgi:hypothetical protein